MALEQLGDQPPMSLNVLERCNFASNFAYYNLMYQAQQLTYLTHDTKKALVQASAGLTLSSSFFHGSHTHLGQLLDNLMIKIIAYILYEAYINALDLPETTPLLVTQLSEVGRPLSGIQLAQDITDMFKDDPSHTWMERAQALDVPSYERTFGALILTMDAQAQVGRLHNWLNSLLISKLPFEEAEKTFLTNFKSEIKEVFAGRDILFVEQPDQTNKWTTGTKFLLAFIFHESYEFLAPFQSVVNQIGLPLINNFLNSLTTLPELKSPHQLTHAGILT